MQARKDRAKQHIDNVIDPVIRLATDPVVLPSSAPWKAVLKIGASTWCQNNSKGTYTNGQASFLETVDPFKVLNSAKVVEAVLATTEAAVRLGVSKITSDYTLEVKPSGVTAHVALGLFAAPVTTLRSGVRAFADIPCVLGLECK